MSDAQAALFTNPQAQRFAQLERDIKKREAENLPCSRLREQLDREVAAAIEKRELRQAHEVESQLIEALPISQAAGELSQLIQDHRVCVITGETGSGKSTQLPKIVWSCGFGRRGGIVMTQPRRIAARSIADRLREECAVDENAIAHAFRFDDRRQPSTAITVMTDGFLLAGMANDSLLGDYEVLIIDEAHERSTNIDVLLAQCCRLLKERDDFRVIITSASIDAQRFADYFSRECDRHVPVQAVGGRQYAVELHYRPLESRGNSWLDGVADEIVQVHEEEEPGAFLCFLPTERDILELRKRLQDMQNVTVLPLFSRLTPAEQRAVFKPVRGRKIVLSTNIAETSLTVPDVTVVIDTGLAREKRFNGASGVERLPVSAISQAACQQRSGRAGRTGPGRCYRLFSEDDFNRRLDYTEPEILRCNLAGVVLHCLQLRIGTGEDLPWLDAPKPQAWRQALGQLEELGALRKNKYGKWNLSKTGWALAQLPLDPAQARVLLAAQERGVLGLSATVVAFTSIADPRLRPPEQRALADSAHAQFAHPESDIGSILQLWEAYHQQESNSARHRWCDKNFLSWQRMREWCDLRRQLLQTMSGVKKQQGAKNQALALVDHHWPERLDGVHASLCSGFARNLIHIPEQQKQRQQNKKKLGAKKERPQSPYRRGNGDIVTVHPSSSLARRKQPKGTRSDTAPKAEILMSLEMVFTSQLFARLCFPIEKRWVLDYMRARCEKKRSAYYFHARSGKVRCRERYVWAGVELESKEIDAPADVEAQVCLIQAVLCDLAADKKEITKISFGHELYRILRQNKLQCSALRSLPARLRDARVSIDEDGLRKFYQDRIAALKNNEEPYFIAGLDALLVALKQYRPEQWIVDMDYCVEANLWQRAEAEFPQKLEWGARSWPLRYRYDPGHELDGIALRCSQDEVGQLLSAPWQCILPGFAIRALAHWLQQLPKAKRRELIDGAAAREFHAEALARKYIIEIQQAYPEESLALACNRFMKDRYAISLLCDESNIPSEERLYFEIIDQRTEEVLYAGRDPIEHGSDPRDPFRAWRASFEQILELDLRQENDRTEFKEFIQEYTKILSLAGQDAYVGLLRTRNRNAEAVARKALFMSKTARDVSLIDGMRAFILQQYRTVNFKVVDIAQAERMKKNCGMSPAALQPYFASAHLLEQLFSTDSSAAVLNHFVRTAEEYLSRSWDEAAKLLKSMGTAWKGQQSQRATSFAAAATQRLIPLEMQRLFQGNWYEHLTWNSCQVLVRQVLALQTLKPKEAESFQKQRELIVGDWNEAQRYLDPRMYALLPDFISLAYERELLIYEKIISVPVSDKKQTKRHRSTWRQILQATVDEAISFEQKYNEACREIKRIADLQNRLPVRDIRSRWVRQSDVFDGKLDLSYGADLEGQLNLAKHFLKRGREILDQT